MANEEMSVVQKRDDQTLERYIEQITFYYGTNDHWVPNDIPKYMKYLYPDGEILECTQKYMHAFVLKHSKDLANIVFHRIN